MAMAEKCVCPDAYCPEHAVCPHDGSKLIILEGDPAFCEICQHDVMPAKSCGTKFK